ncbi:hypothetical protein LR48_Vigan10g028100 [Vigna angularis]|uniref:Uncharacterized protein n=1 Tax=Phaseolus angularis TaxID=3914 RepID=A0A0L9VI57_PHAAN|nr:hypothetical protein LR48_Vigan10g028100 [Vigna angularis]
MATPAQVDHHLKQHPQHVTTAMPSSHYPPSTTPAATTTTGKFSENFECDCESGSCSICAEIGFALHPDSKFITDAIKCEFDDKNADLKENAGADIKELMIDEEEYTATSLSEPEISIPVSQTPQLLVEGEILLKQIATRRILMKQFFLKFSLLNPVIENISLLVQVWQLPP